MKIPLASLGVTVINVSEIMALIQWEKKGKFTNPFLMVSIHHSSLVSMEACCRGGTGIDNLQFVYLIRKSLVQYLIKIFHIQFNRMFNLLIKPTFTSNPA